MRPLGPATATAWLAWAMTVRLLREGLLVRAVLWPSLLTGAVLLGTAGVATALTRAEVVLVSDAETEAALRAAQVPVRQVPDAATTWERSAWGSAAWREGDGWVVGGMGSQADLAERALRDHAGASWRIVKMSDEGRARATQTDSSALVAILSVLFTLYAGVLGAGLPARELADGTLESDLALPVPRWVHGLARLGASALTLALALAGSILLFHAIIGVDEVSAWVVHGSAACAAASAVGLGAAGLSGPRGGFAAPFSRTATTVVCALGVGAALPTLGAQLPIATVGALAVGAVPGPAALVGTALVGLASVALFPGRAP